MSEFKFLRAIEARNLLWLVESSADTTWNIILCQFHTSKLGSETIFYREAVSASISKVTNRVKTSYLSEMGLGIV